MAGFEGSDHINSQGTPLSMNELTQHITNAADDYRRLAQFGISTVRESIGWQTCGAKNYDFSLLESRAVAAAKLGIQICWTFLHYGIPADVDLFRDDFPTRFADFCAAATQYLKRFSLVDPIYTPVNEISFHAFALAHTHHMHPFKDMHAHAGRIKEQLLAASLAGAMAIRNIDPAAQFLQGDPAIYLVPPADRPELAEAAQRETNSQYGAWDWLNQRGVLDVVSLHHYHSNQWECATGERLHWHLHDPRRKPLRDIISDCYHRYGRPMIVGETSHIGVGRGPWILEVAKEVAASLAAGVPVKGICLYPIVDRQDWEDLNHWHNSGLWDYAHRESTLERILNVDYAMDVRLAQTYVIPRMSDGTALPLVPMAEG
jgi:UDP-galactopyranose mutase